MLVTKLLSWLLRVEDSLVLYYVYIYIVRDRVKRLPEHRQTDNNIYVEETSPKEPINHLLNERLTSVKLIGFLAPYKT